MADTKAIKIEREYIIPLRRAWVNVPEYKRARKAVMTIKKFIARHMKVDDRNIKNVKLDVYLNNEIWFRGHSKPPAKIKVKAIKEGDIVQVKFAETPQYVNFLKIKNLKAHKKAEVKKPEEKREESAQEQQTEEQKTNEKEKEKAVEQQNIKQAEQQTKAQKHTTKAKEQQIHRMALKK